MAFRLRMPPFPNSISNIGSTALSSCSILSESPSLLPQPPTSVQRLKITFFDNNTISTNCINFYKRKYQKLLQLKCLQLKQHRHQVRSQVHDEYAKMKSFQLHNECSCLLHQRKKYNGLPFSLLCIIDNMLLPSLWRI